MDEKRKMKRLNESVGDLKVRSYLFSVFNFPFLSLICMESLVGV